MTAFAPLASTTLAQSSTNANYIIGAGSGTFALSMRGAALLIGDIFPYGLFQLDGRPVTFSVQRPYPINNGSFTLSGQDIILDRNFGLIVDSVYNNATFTYTGQSVELDVAFGINAETGTFSFSGQDIDFTKQMNVSAETGTFTYTGQDALKGISEAFDVGNFTYTGQTVEMTVQRHFDVTEGSFTYTFAADIKSRGWFSPTATPAIWAGATLPDPIWTEVSALPDPIWTDAA